MPEETLNLLPAKRLECNGPGKELCFWQGTALFEDVPSSAALREWNGHVLTEHTPGYSIVEVKP